MNILLLGTAHPWRGGIAHYFALLYRYLSKRHHVDIVTFRRQYPAMLYPGKTQTEIGDPGIVLTTEQRVDSINPLNWLLTGWALRKRNYDVVLFKYWLPFFGPCFGTICRVIKYRRRTKVFAICDNVIPHERRLGDVLFTRYAFGSVDSFLVQSETVEQDLLKTVQHPKYMRVAHPIYENFGSPLSKSEARKLLGIPNEKVVLFFGYIRPYKGVDLLLEAMKLLPASENIRLLLVGEFYENEERYRKFIRRNDLEHAVNVVSEYVPNAEVPKYFSAADCVVLPYRSATQSGIVQIAYNFDKPVIVTNVGGLTEMVSDGVTGIVIPPNSPQILADAIMRFYRDKLEEKLVHGVRKEKQKYSWDTVVQAIEKLAS